MTWAGLENLNSKPSYLDVPEKSTPKEDKIAFLEEQIGRFVDEYCLTEADVEGMWQSQNESVNATQSHQTVTPTDQLYRPGKIQNYTFQGFHL